MADPKGMVQFGGVTYRIVKIRRARYDVIRILDDTFAWARSRVSPS